MKLHELQYTEGARKTRKRVGRGTSSGTGKTAGRGQKGQGARSGGGKKPGFEGGQTPLFMRLPKRGFTNFNKLEYAIVNLDQLNTFEAGTVVCPKALKEAGICGRECAGGRRFFLKRCCSGQSCRLSRCLVERRRLGRRSYRRICS